MWRALGFMIAVMTFGSVSAGCFRKKYGDCVDDAFQREFIRIAFNTRESLAAKQCRIYRHLKNCSSHATVCSADDEIEKEIRNSINEIPIKLGCVDDSSMKRLGEFVTCIGMNNFGIKGCLASAESRVGKDDNFLGFLCKSTLPTNMCMMEIIGKNCSPRVKDFLAAHHEGDLKLMEKYCDTDSITLSTVILNNAVSISPSAESEIMDNGRSGT